MEKIYVEGHEERTIELMDYEEKEEDSTYYEVCCGKYWKATVIGVFISFFTLCTGIDVV